MLDITPPCSLTTLLDTPWYNKCEAEARALHEHMTDDLHAFSLDIGPASLDTRMLAAWRWHTTREDIVASQRDETLRKLRTYRAQIKHLPLSPEGLPILFEALVAMYLVDDRFEEGDFDPHIVHMPRLDSGLSELDPWTTVIEAARSTARGEEFVGTLPCALREVLRDDERDWLAHTKSLMASRHELTDLHTHLDRAYAKRLLDDPKKFKSSSKFEREYLDKALWQELAHIHPATLIADLRKRWLQDTRDSLGREPENAQVRRYVASMIWHVAASAFWNHAPIQAAMHKLGLMTALCVAELPFSVTKKDEAFNAFSHEKYFAHPEVLDHVVSLWSEAGQHHLVFDLFQNRFSKRPKFSEFLDTMIDSGYDPTRAAVTIWTHGPARSRTSLFEDRVQSAPNDLVLDVITPLFEKKLTASHFKTILELLQPRTFTESEQTTLADLARHLSGKSRTQLLALAPDVPAPKPLARVKPKKAPASSKKAPQPVHECLDKIRPFRLQKHLDGLVHEDLTWQDGTPLNQEEFERLITVLRAEDTLQASHPFIQNILAHLDPEGAHALSVRLLERWEALDFPSQHKWMLFQMRHMARKEAVVALTTRHNWGTMVSSFWARASWYLELIADVGPAKKSDALFLDLLDRGTLDGTLQKFARDAFWRFAKQSGLDDPNDYFEARGILNTRPSPKPLSFSPGKTTFEAAGITYTVHVSDGELLLIDQSHKRSRDVPEGSDATTREQLAQWQREVTRHAIHWGAHYEHMFSRNATITLKELRDHVLDAEVTHRDVITHLLWRDEQGTLLRLDEEAKAFDANYDPVDLPDDTPLRIIDLAMLATTRRAAWTTHFADEEIVFPFDILDRKQYIALVDALITTPLAVRDVILGLSELGYRASSMVEDGGYVHTHYKTFHRYNARVFVDHSGMNVSNGESATSPSKLEGLWFTDLLGRRLDIEHVPVALYAQLHDELSTLHTPEAFS